MRILITESENFSKNAIALLQKKFDVTILDLQTIDELGEIIQDFDVLFVRLRFKLTTEILEKAKKLKYILTATTGLDHIDTGFFENVGGKVISLKGETAFLETIPSTAEHTWALLLSLIKKIPSSFDDVKKGNWNRDNFKGNNLRHKKIGILGLGRVGKQVANFAKAFQMDISYYDVLQIDSEYKAVKTPKELFEWAEIISIHIPYSQGNKNFVDKSLLDCLKSNSVLINTSRGAIWEENYICQLLKQNKIKGIATDVIQNEFDKKTILQNPLIKLANENYNVIVTPHIAGASFESMEMTEDFIVQKFLTNL